MSNVLIVSGAGEYSDPWHPFPDTTAELFGILRPHHTTAVTTEVASALASLKVAEWGLVVMNFGSDEHEVSTDSACVDGVQAYLRAGGALLASHVVATAFPADSRWEEILGGRWVRGTTMHPPKGDAEIEIRSLGHPVTNGVRDFTLTDERYSYLRVSEAAEILATHWHDDIEHPVVWAHEWHGARVVYDGLGHDAESYESEDHRRLVSNAAAWLLAANHPKRSSPPPVL